MTKRTPSFEYHVYELDSSKRSIWLSGRDVWALDNLMAAGKSGCTPVTHIGPRWSAYIFNLRNEHGLNIETKHEAYSGPFPGTHARYVLHSTVVKVSEPEAA